MKTHQQPTRVYIPALHQKATVEKYTGKGQFILRLPGGETVKKHRTTLKFISSK